MDQDLLPSIFVYQKADMRNKHAKSTAKSSIMNDTREFPNPELKKSAKDFYIITTIILIILCGKTRGNKYLESVNDFQDLCSR